MKDRKAKDNEFKFVKAIQDGDNVKAYKLLEKLMKSKVADKIDDALKQM